LNYQQWTGQLALTAGPAKIAFTEQNQLAIVTWCAYEGPDALNNPLNDTRSMVGSWPVKGNSARVQNYTSIAEGIAAVLLTLSSQGFGYPAIMAALAKGDCACAVTEAIARSAWGTWYLNPEAAIAAVEAVNRDYAAYATRQVYGGS
jgi:hypothetical protein